MIYELPMNQYTHVQSVPEYRGRASFCYNGKKLINCSSDCVLQMASQPITSNVMKISHWPIGWRAWRPSTDSNKNLTFPTSSVLQGLNSTHNRPRVDQQPWKLVDSVSVTMLARPGACTARSIRTATRQSIPRSAASVCHCFSTSSQTVLNMLLMESANSS